MIVTTVQNPLKVDPVTDDDHLLMAVDRGNSGCKIAVSVNGTPLTPFKIPSVIRRVEADGVIEINGQSFVCGDAALSMTVGTASTPLRTGDKVRDLSVVIAQAVQKISETHTLTSSLKLSLIVSSPFRSDVLVSQVKSELKKLENAFTVNGCEYSVSIEAVTAAFEGAVLLESDREYNGVVDIGFGTILAAYRGQSGKVAIAPLMGGDQGGCNLVLNSLLNDPAFLSKVKASGASAPPSAEKLSAKLSEGVTELRGIDLKPMLRTHLKGLKQRIEDAAQSVATEIRLSHEDAPIPRIALVGGGACLLRLVLSEDQLKTWGAKHSIEIFESPDYQTAMSMHQLTHVKGGF